MEEQTYRAGGFAFADEKLAEQAKKELEGIKYIRSRTDMENPEMVLQVYHQLIAENIFETPVGICFLKELQEYLRTNPRILNGDIQEIPVRERKKETVKKEAEGPGKQEKPERKKEKRQVQLKEKHVNYKSRYRMLLAVCVTLVVIVAAMFAITFTSNNPNILNYENEIINKYEDWEQRLEEKEEQLKQREEALENTDFT